MFIAHDPCMESVLRILPRGAARLGLDIAPAQLERFALLCSLLIAASAEINVTAISEPDEVVTRHFLDSLTVLPALHGYDAVPAQILDVGTGGGMPGLAIAIMRPAWQLTLLDSVAKKVRFVVAAASRLELENVETISSRAETIARGPGRDGFDVCVARAVAPTGVLVEYCAPLVRPGGRICLLKKGDLTADLGAAQRVGPLLGCHEVRTVPVDPTVGLGDDRYLIELYKTSSTPAEFPRRLGLARRRPL